MNPLAHVVYQSLQNSANIYCTVLQPCEVSSFPPLRTCSQHIPKSSTVPCVPLCGLCQSVCAALTQPESIVLESRVVSGLEATVLVWIWGRILAPQSLHGTTEPWTDRGQSVVPCKILSHRTDSKQGQKLETCLRPTDVSLLNGKTSQLRKLVSANADYTQRRQVG